MVQLNGRKRNNFFCRRVYSCPGLEGSGDYSFKMENPGRGEYLSSPTESQWLYYRLSSQNDRATGGEGVGGKFERSAGSVAVDGAFFKGGFFRLRQAGEDQSQRQASGACRDKGESCLGG